MIQFFLNALKFFIIITYMNFKWACIVIFDK